jgi:hypothetical protein
MPRIIVTADPVDQDAPVMLDEQITAIHVSDKHASRQLMERVAWAVQDAERVEEQVHV